jgi:hypothetical protein
MSSTEATLFDVMRRYDHAMVAWNRRRGIWNCYLMTTGDIPGSAISASGRTPEESYQACVDKYREGAVRE